MWNQVNYCWIPWFIFRRKNLVVCTSVIWPGYNLSLNSFIFFYNDSFVSTLSYDCKQQFHNAILLENKSSASCRWETWEHAKSLQITFCLQGRRWQSRNLFLCCTDHLFKCLWVLGVLWLFPADTCYWGCGGLVPEADWCQATLAIFPRESWVHYPPFGSPTKQDNQKQYRVKSKQELSLLLWASAYTG